jgi:hypothetical protein
MKFMMFVCMDGSALESPSAEPPPSDDDGHGDGDSFPWLEEMVGRGVRLDGDQLRPPDQARTVRVRGGEVLLTDGPFAETKEVIIGYDVLECADLDEAVEVAAKHPVAQMGTIEVRPFRWA